MCLSALSVLFFPAPNTTRVYEEFNIFLPSAVAYTVASSVAPLTFLVAALTPAILFAASTLVLREHHKLFGGNEVFNGKDAEATEVLQFLSRKGLLHPEALKLERISELGRSCIFKPDAYLGAIFGGLARISGVLER
jgi:hypothetical protein